MAANFTLTMDGKYLKIVSQTSMREISLVGASFSIGTNVVTILGQTGDFKFSFSDIDTKIMGGSLPNGYTSMLEAFNDVKAAIVSANP